MAYFLAAKLGLSLATINNAVSPVWPATGLSISLLLFKGPRYWPAISIGAFAVNSLTGNPFLPVFLITIGNTLEALSGFAILNYFLKNKEKFNPHAKTLAVILASIVSSAISSTIGTLSLSLFELSPWESFSSVWLTWWTGDTLGGIILIPLFLAFFKNGFDKFVAIKPNLTSLLSVFFSGVILCFFLFIRPGGAPFLFFIFPLLLWCVNTLGERGIIVTTAMISFLGIMSVNFGYGVFIHGSENANLINLQLFLGSVGISSLIMTDIKRISSLKQPAIILLFSWLLAGILFFGFLAKTMYESKKHFNAIVEGVEPMLDARIKLYFSGLQSGKALFAASESVTKDEWRAFLENGHYTQILPGMSGMGVVFRVKKDKLESFLLQMKKNNIDNFNYSTLADGEDFSRKFNEAYLVTYIEPQQGNEKKIGLDLASEPIRKSAADLARDLGEPTLTGSIRLVDDLAANIYDRPAFLAMYPFYKNGTVPELLNQRRLNHIGWIYSPIYIKEFFESIFALGNFKEISYAVYETVDDKLELINFSPEYFELPENGELSREIKLGNRRLQFHFKRSSNFYSSQDNFASWTGAISSIISLLIGTFIISLQTVKRRAIDLAAKKTKDLAANEELWKFALQGAGDGVWDLYIQDDIIKFTKDFKQSLGYAPFEVGDSLGEWNKLVHQEDFSKLNRIYKKHLAGLGHYNSEYRLRTKSGDYKWFLVRGSVVSWDEAGKPLRMVGTITDITARKIAEHELENQKEKLNSIFEGSSDALILLDEKGGFFDCNTRALKIFNLKNKSELYSCHPSAFSPPTQADGMDSYKKAQQEIKKAFNEGSNRFEWTHKKITGESFPAEVLLTAFTYEGKKVLQACVRDLTDRKLIEVALSAQREKLVASAKMSSLGEMAGGIAHEINNPLAIILGKTAQMKRRLKLSDSLTLEQDEGLNTIEATAKRIGAIIKGLSAFSRNAENDSMEKVLVPVLILDTLELSKERFKFHSITLRYDLSAVEKTYVFGRAAQLLQVLVNLLNNAYDAVEFLPEKWVEIETEVFSETCRIRVTDSGPGIAPELLEKIMTPFFSTKSVGKGTGLGLSISKGIIEDHKGVLYYDKEHANTSFVIELPIA